MSEIAPENFDPIAISEQQFDYATCYIPRLKKGLIDFLTKPVDGPKLLETIRISLEKDAENRRQRKISAEINAQINLLTAREFEVMTWVITGMLNKQIAGEMNISEETVKIHRGRVMHKLEIVSVAELVRLCERIGISPAKTDII